MIALKRSAAGTRSDNAARTMLEKLGVASLNKLDDSTLIAPFSCLETISFWDKVAGSRRLRLPETIKRVFFHTLESPQNCERLLRQLLRDPAARLIEVSARPADFVFSGIEQDVCGPLTGLTIRSDEDTPCWGLLVQKKPSDKARPLIEVGSAGVLWRLKQKDVDIFMLFTSRLADPDRPLKTNLDIRTCLLSLAAPMMVLKYLVRGVGWSARNNYANLIIDDPPLALRYGHIDFRRLYDLSSQHNARVTLAYIPFNYLRGNDKTIGFFKKVSDRMATCVHGCDHTRSEFGHADSGRISALASLAADRMNSFTERTGIPHSKIMVFPQGGFSLQALAVLKRHNFDAAVNTELKSTSGERHVTIKDMLQPAVTSYGGFPLFLRRKISDGIANIAFDLLLGKPCLIVAHHADFGSERSPVWQLVDAINNLPNPPTWRPLEEIVARTALSRPFGNDMVELKIYSRTADLKNIPVIPAPNYIRVIKDEPHPGTIDRVLMGEREAQWRVEEGRVIVDVGRHSESSRLTVVYSQNKFEPPPTGLKYHLGVWCRRRLGEFRDNYVAKSELRRSLGL